MATYRVPPAGGFNGSHAAPASVTRGPEPIASNGSRRPSVSNDSPPLQPTTTTAGTAKPADVAMVPMGASTAKQTQLATRQTYIQRHPEEVKPGWSRGRKICCGLLLFFIAALITIGVLIAFMVRMPSVDYKDYRIICANNDFVQCATKEFQVLVFLEVDNPNILGATINAELALYWEGEFIGPGTIEDTSVGKRGQTELQALFTINSAKGLEVGRALLLPPQRSVVLDVEGTVYVHVGLLRPSGQFDDRFTIDPPNLSDLINGAIGGAEIPSIPPGVPSDVVDAITGRIPPDAGQTIVDSIPGVPGDIADLIPNIPGVGGKTKEGEGDTTTASPANAGNPTQLSVIRAPRLRGGFSGAVPYLMTPRQFVREMQKIGALPKELGTPLKRRVHRQLRHTQRLGQ